MRHNKESLLMSLNQTSTRNPKASSQDVNKAAPAVNMATTAGIPSAASVPFPPNRNPSMQGASASEVPNHPPRATSTPATGSPTAHARTSKSASAPSTLARAQTNASASALSFANTSADNKDNHSGKPRTPSRPAHLFCAETTHTLSSTPLHSTTSTTTTTTTRDQTSHATIGGRAGASNGPESVERAIGSHLDTDTGAENWTTVQSKVRAPTSTVVVLSLNGKDYTFDLDPMDRTKVLVQVKGSPNKYTVCKRYLEETVFNRDFRAPKPDCHDGKCKPFFCKNFITGRKCGEDCKKRVHIVLPVPTPKAPVVVASAPATASSVPSGAKLFAAAASAPPKPQEKKETRAEIPTVTLKLDDSAYTFPVKGDKLRVTVKKPDGTTRTVDVCANWFEKTVFNKAYRAPQTGCCAGEHGRPFCKNVLTGGSCSKKCDAFFHMVLPTATKVVASTPKVVASTPKVVDITSAAFPELASNATLKAQGAMCQTMCEQMKITPTAKPASTAVSALVVPAKESEVVSKHIDESRIKTQLCKWVKKGTPEKCDFHMGRKVDYKTGEKIPCAFSHDPNKVRALEEFRAQFDKKLRSVALNNQEIFEEVVSVMTKNVPTLYVLGTTYVDDKKAKRHLHHLKKDIVSLLEKGEIEPRHFKDLVLMWSAAASITRADDTSDRYDRFVLFGEEDGPRENEVWEYARRLHPCNNSYDYARKDMHYRAVAAAVTARANPIYAAKYTKYWNISGHSGCTGGRFCRNGAHFDLDSVETCTNLIDVDLLCGIAPEVKPVCMELALLSDVPARFACQATAPNLDAAVELEEMRASYIETLLAFLRVKEELDALDNAPIQETQRRKLQGKCDAKRTELVKAEEKLAAKKDAKDSLIRCIASHAKLVTRLCEETRSALKQEETHLAHLQKAAMSEPETETETKTETETEADSDICFESPEPVSAPESEPEPEPVCESESDDEELDGNATIAKHFTTTQNETELSGKVKKDIEAATERCATLREAVERFVNPAFKTIRLSAAKRFPAASEADRKQLTHLEDTILRSDEKLAAFDTEIAIITVECDALKKVIEVLQEEHNAAVAEAISASAALASAFDTVEQRLRFRDLSAKCIRLEEQLNTQMRKMDNLNKTVVSSKSKGICLVTSFCYAPLKPLPRKETQLVAQKVNLNDDFDALVVVAPRAPALTGFGSVASVIPALAIEYPSTTQSNKQSTTQSTPKPSSALRLRARRKQEEQEQEQEEDEEEDYISAMFGTFAKYYAAGTDLDKYQQSPIVATPVTVVRCTFACERHRTKEMKELSRASAENVAPKFLPFTCDQTECPYRVLRLNRAEKAAKAQKDAEAAASLRAIRKAAAIAANEVRDTTADVNWTGCVMVEAEYAEKVQEPKVPASIFAPLVEKAPKAPKVARAPKAPKVAEDADAPRKFWQARPGYESDEEEPEESFGKVKKLKEPEDTVTITEQSVANGKATTTVHFTLAYDSTTVQEVAKKLKKECATNTFFAKCETGYQIVLYGTMSEKVAKYLVNARLANESDIKCDSSVTRQTRTGSGKDKKSKSTKDQRDVRDAMAYGRK